MTFYATIGQRYRDEPHPADPRLHPDGFITVHAPNTQRAVDAVTAFTMGKWSGIYPEAVWDGSVHYPRGNLMTIEA